MGNKEHIVEIVETRRVTLEGYIKCQQGVSVLGLGIFCQLNKYDPDILHEVERSIRDTGTLDDSCGDELIRDVIRHLLILKMDFDELLTHSHSIYMGLARKYKCKTSLMLSQGPQMPTLPLSDFEGLAIYAGQLMVQFEDVMHGASRFIATCKADGILALDVQEGFEDLCRSLTALV